MQRVIPIQTLFIILVIWTAMDLADLFWLHWFPDITAETVATRAFWEGAIIIAGYITGGQRIGA